jgi:hypothetical protein
VQTEAAPKLKTIHRSQRLKIETTGEASRWFSWVRINDATMAPNRT